MERVVINKSTKSLIQREGDSERGSKSIPRILRERNVAKKRENHGREKMALLGGKNYLTFK